MIFSWSDVVLPGTFSDVWRYFGLLQLEKALLESGGKGWYFIMYCYSPPEPSTFLLKVAIVPRCSGSTVWHRITSQCGSWALAVWLERIDTCCQCQRHTTIPKTSCKNVNYHIHTSTFWNSILNIFGYIKCILKINFTSLFLFFVMGLLENFKLHIWLTSVAHNTF